MTKAVMEAHSGQIPSNYMEADFGCDLAVVIASLDGDQSVTNEASEALERIVEGYGRVLINVAGKFAFSRNLQTADFVQSGVEGLYDALWRVDATKDPKQFLAYSHLRIFDAMFKQSALVGGSVSVSEGTLKKVVKAHKIQNRINERQATDERFQELLEEFEMTETGYLKALRTFKLMYAWYVGAAPLDEAELLTHDEGPYVADTAELFEDKEKVVLLHKLIDGLSDREKYIVRCYFGMDDNESMTLAQIAEKLGLTESRISQIVTELKKSFRKAFSRHGY